MDTIPFEKPHKRVFENLEKKKEVIESFEAVEPLVSLKRTFF